MKPRPCVICGKPTQSSRREPRCRQCYLDTVNGIITKDFTYNPAAATAGESFFDTAPERTHYMESKLNPAWAGDTLE